MDSSNNKQVIIEVNYNFIFLNTLNRYKLNKFLKKKKKTEETSIAELLLRIKERKCFKFSSSTELCTGCKNTLDKHKDKTSLKWTPLECTLSESTNTYGDLRFPGSCLKRAKVNKND
jgi:hypothetical protein